MADSSKKDYQKLKNDYLIIHSTHTQTKKLLEYLSLKKWILDLLVH